MHPRDDAKMKDDVDSDPGTGLAKEDAKLKDDDPRTAAQDTRPSPGSDLCNDKITGNEKTSQL